MLLIAVDPGKAGGIAIAPQAGNFQAFKMPQTDGDVIEFFNRIIPENSIISEKVVCYMEKVGGFTGPKRRYVSCPRCGTGVPYNAGDPGSHMFKFGYGNGFLVSTIMTRKIPLEMTPPQRWIKALGLGVKGSMTTTQWKNKLKDMAQKLYPDIKVILATADALLILKYARVMEGRQQLNDGGSF